MGFMSFSSPFGQEFVLGASYLFYLFIYFLSLCFLKTKLSALAWFTVKVGDFGSNSDRVSLAYVAAGRVFKTNCLGIEESVV